jgi:hypothetical protein
MPKLEFDGRMHELPRNKINYIFLVRVDFHNLVPAVSIVDSVDWAMLIMIKGATKKMM